ncbi:MAG: YaaL family protein [Lachnospiraceae bacterium]|nr:YaaL family protein [Lachnospiraceae bacterium]
METSFSKKKNVNSELLQIMKDIDKTKFALETAYSNFDNVTEPDLIDCYIYEVNSSLKRYKYLLEQAAKLSSPPEKTQDKKLLNVIAMPKIHDLNLDLPCSLLTGLFRK